MEDNNFNNGDNPIFNVEPLNRSMNNNNENDANIDPIFNVEPLHSNNVESENSQNSNYNAEPLQSSTNNNVQNETNLDNNNYANGNNVGGVSFANVEPLQKRTEQGNTNNQQTDYLNDTTPEAGKTINGRKYTTVKPVFATYAFLLFIFSIFTSVIANVNPSDALDPDKYISLFATIGIKVGIYIIIAAIISIFIAFIKKYIDKEGFATFKKAHIIFIGVWAFLNICSRLSSYMELTDKIDKLKKNNLFYSYSSDAYKEVINAEIRDMTAKLRTGMILNTLIILAAMVIILFLINKIVEKKFTIKDQEQL